MHLYAQALILLTLFSNNYLMLYRGGNFSDKRGMNMRVVIFAALAVTGGN